MDPLDRKTYLEQVSNARQGRQPAQQPAPAARAPSPTPVKPPDRAKPSSPIRASESVSDDSSTAFPTLEGTAFPVPEPKQNPPTHPRRRSASFREGGAVEAVQWRDAQISATVKTEAPFTVQSRPSAFREEFSVIMPKSKVFKPGPAKLKPNSTPQEWLQCALRNKYLPENIMKELCEICKRALMEESNIQPVSTPVTICGDLHGQFYDVLELFRVAGGLPSDDDNTVEASPAPKRVITSDDIEPPTEITDPKLKKKIKNISVEDRTASSGANDEDDAEEENRGRSREPANEASLGPLKEGNTGIPGNQNYIFLGDFVDRGYFSLETLTLLLCLKACYPSRITLVRGNHESRQITQVYGFYEECSQKYGNASVWKACCQVFDFLVLGAIVDGKVLCVHGGLSPEIRTLDQIRVIARAQEIPHEGAFCDLVWSDPEDIGTWAISPRGAGWLFGDKVAAEFNHVNNFTLIARAHQLVNEGFKHHFPEKSVVTVWSAPNYCYRCGNVASIMNLGEDLKPKFTIFSAVPDNQRAVPVATGRRNDYFL